MKLDIVSDYNQIRWNIHGERSYLNVKSELCHIQFICCNRNIFNCFFDSVEYVTSYFVHHFLYSLNRQVCKKFANKFNCRSDFSIYWNWSLESVRVFCPLDLLIQLSTSNRVSVVSIASLPPGMLEVWKIRSIFNQWFLWLNCLNKTLSNFG